MAIKTADRCKLVCRFCFESGAEQVRLLWDLSDTLDSVLALALNGAQAKDAAKVGRDGLRDDRLFFG